MKPFDAKILLQAAQDATGLSDFGPNDFRDGLDILVSSINANNSVNDERWDDAFDFIVRLLKNRLWFTKDVAGHPEILEQKLLPPVVILPLPRTGSTKLQRMLDASNSFQPLLFWRLFMFARIPGLPDGGAAARLQETKDYEKWLYSVCPDYIKGHPIFAEEADEEQILHRFTFRAPILTTMFYAPEAMRWVRQSDPAPMYQYMLQQLKYLQWQFHRGNVKPWLLKAPTNVGFENHLVDVLGRDIKIICPHRDPVNIVCSIIKVSEYTSSVYSDLMKNNKKMANEKAKRMLAFLADSAARHIEWRGQNPGIEILDLSYNEINQNAPDVLRSVYKYLGLELTPEIQASAAGWEQNKDKNKFSRNTYAPEEFGLTKREIHDAFAPYIHKFAKYF